MASWEDDQVLVDDQYEDHQESQFQSHGLSRLATCTSSSTLDYENLENIDDDPHGTVGTMFSGLCIDDQEFCDRGYGPDGRENSSRGCLFLDSDDDKEPIAAAWCSLPASPLHEQRSQADDQSKQYLSDNNCGKLSRMRKRVLRRKQWEERKTSLMNDEDDENTVEMKMNMTCLSQNSFSGESEGGLRVITRPKGGKRALCMDMEEVKACRDLGFELEHQQMFDLSTTPSRMTLSASTLDTTSSSGGSSPIPNWHISSPGDAPKDVKARLKVWAQAVALASSSSWRHLTS
ncbi:hypothetical protein DCAR_0103087 [Daucus carota subsp. sativus]|uniref:Uncharacterized protein n=1 Tax=Daucus carota subsp. sativus TaxID=79200 RepID=A0A166HQZ0_DAUCS|nr:PREDICTED: uncharacterized protein LOC108194401 [Daucus carota subsp. sativus]WOG83909.1 hypothetical protein DCAR_0103087 [Daucus carota subsp. sativus]